MAGPVDNNRFFLSRLSEYTDIILAVAVVMILAVLVLPVPPRFLDFLLAFNITLSLIILLVTMYLTRPLDFSVFPGMLLIVTLFRLALNVASTRLILSRAYAGEVISSFGNFVVGGNYLVGFIIFCILIIIQFVVITKGAGRIAEVAARFTLDAMPGKQMAIDADLNAGLITEEEAKRRRLEIGREADFYGAMDGASKFVRGDAVAGILITIINIIGGIIIGVVQKGMSAGQALSTYTLLTVGDGLVTQIPALIVSTAAGIIVTRAASESNLGKDLTRQLTFQPRAIMIAAAVLVIFGLVPGMPTLPFMLLGGVAGLLTYAAVQSRRKRPAEGEIIEEKKEISSPERMEEFLKVDPMEIEIGYALIPLVDVGQDSDLLDRIAMIRRQMAQEIGLMVPPIRIRDNMQLKPNEYHIKIRGHKVASAELYPGQFLAIDPGYVTEPVEGLEVNEPAFGLKAKWISENVKPLAERCAYTVVEPSAVLATHLIEVIRTHAAELLTRQEVANLIENLRKDHKALVEEVIPTLVPLGTVQKVLQNLLEERLPIRDLPKILEVLADYATASKEPDVLAEYVRHHFARTITEMYKNSVGGLTVATLDPGLENKLASMVQATKHGLVLVVPPELGQKLNEAASQLADEMRSLGYQPLLLVSPNIRLVLRRFIKHAAPGLAVISYNEILPEVEVESIKVVRVDYDN